MTDQDNILIDKVIRKEVSQHEMELFQKRMVDPIFKAEYDQLMTLQDVMMDYKKESLKKELQTLDHQLFQKAQPKKSKWVLFLLLLLSMVVILGYYAITNTEEKPLDNQELYAQFYIPHPNVVDPLTKGDEDGPMSYTQFYELGQYENAINAMPLSATEMDQWYKAQIYMAKGDLIKAQELLQDIAYGQGIYAGSSKWFLALIHINNGENDLAKRLLNSVVGNKSNSYVTQAQHVLDRL